MLLIKNAICIFLLFLGLIVINQFNAYAVKEAYAYVSDRDNIYPNGNGVDFTVKNGYLYVLLDTGNVGVLKLFKIINGFNNHKGRDYRDDFIEWNVYFGDNNNYYLPKGHLLFNKGENLRLVLQQREDDYHNRIRIIDVNTEGQVIFEKELGITFGNDLIIAENMDMTAENYGEVFTGIYTEKFDGEKSYVKVVQFTANGEIIHSTNIKDDNYSLEAKQIQIAENGEIAVVSIYNKYNCFWNFIVSTFDNSLNSLGKYHHPSIDLVNKMVYMWRSVDNYQWLFAIYRLRTDNKLEYMILKLFNELGSFEIIEVGGSFSFDVRYDYVHFTTIIEPYPKYRFYYYQLIRKKSSETICDIDSTFWITGSKFITPTGNDIYSSEPSNDLTIRNIKAKQRSRDSVYNCCLIRNKLCIDINYFTLPTSIENDISFHNEEHRFYFYNNEFADISLPDNYYTDVTLCLYNVIGNKVSEYKLKTDDNSILVPISNLQNGIYFYYIPELNIKGKFGVSR